MRGETILHIILTYFTRSEVPYTSLQSCEVVVVEQLTVRYGGKVLAGVPSTFAALDALQMWVTFAHFRSLRPRVVAKVLSQG